MARTEYGTTWWGQKWLQSLTDIDFDNRIPRGKTYANTGRVQSFKLDFQKHTVKARVTGNYDPFYTVTLKLPEISADQVTKLLDAISASPLILAKLSARELDPDLLTLCDKLGIRLFPSKWSDMEMSCSCPDWAVPCKHIAAVIYKISQEIDANPFVLFSLRGIDLPAELAKRGVSMERALVAEIPTWSSILNRRDTASSFALPGVDGERSGDDEEADDDITTASDVAWTDLPEGPESKEAWLSALTKLTYEKPEYDPTALFELLTEKPAGFIGGDLREKLRKVTKAAARLAKGQLTNLSERTPPVFLADDDHLSPLFCVNTWGRTRTAETLVWKEYDAESKSLKPCRVGVPRADGTTAELHEMFSGYINAKRLASCPEEVEAFYDAWVVATKLVMTEAVMPQIYEPADGCFAVRWIPATSAAPIRAITEQLGRLFADVDRPYLEILKRPDVMSAGVTGEIILGIFIESYIRMGFVKALGTAAYPEEATLFGGGYTDCEDDPAAQAVRLRLSEWLSPLARSETHLKPVLTVRDPWASDEALEADAAASQPLTAELGFLIEETNTAEGLEKRTSYVPMGIVLADDRWKGIRFDAMRTAARLTNYCPELTEILRRGSDSTLVSIEELTPLMFKALPALKLLGVEVILPKSLRRLLSPMASMQVDLAQEWDEGSGFFGLASLLMFDWKVAVGDRPVTPEEFAQLSKQAGRVVRFHDKFMYVDEKALNSIRNHLDAQKQNLTKMEIIRAALTGDYEKSPVNLSDAVKSALEKLFREREIAVPDTVTATLRPYQERGFRWMMRNVQIGLGSILADDMGLGKTLQVITLLDGLRQAGELAGKPALVVVPTSLIPNWQREVKKFAPQLRLHLYYGMARELPQDLSETDMILTTYGTMRSSADRLKKLSFRILILDEAQAIKNWRTSTFKAVKSLKAQAVVAMSGTPVENRLMEYWSIMEATNDGLLGSASHFKKEFADPIEALHDKDIAERFRRITSPFILRRMKTDKSIISDLPEKITTDEYCTLTSEQAAIYATIVKKNLKKLEDGLTPIERRAIVLQLILQLKELCNSPVQYEKKSPYNKPENSGKMERLFEILDELAESGRKTLIFTQFKTMGTLLQKWLKERYGREPKFIHGGVSVAERQRIVDAFQNDRNEKILVLSLKAAGTGLNLTAASAVVHYDLWWNPAVENQATDRAFRIGQKQTVNVYRLISANTFEEKINEMIESKKALAAMTVDSGENWIGDLSNKELQEIFTLHEGEAPKVARATDEKKLPARRRQAILPAPDPMA